MRMQETDAPGMSVSLVARQHGIAPNQLFSWRRLYAEGALSAVSAGEEVVPASDYRALQHQVRELQRLLGKKTAGERDPARCAGSGTAKKRLLRSPSDRRLRRGRRTQLVTLLLQLTDAFQGTVPTSFQLAGNMAFGRIHEFVSACGQ